MKVSNQEAEFRASGCWTKAADSDIRTILANVVPVRRLHPPGWVLSRITIAPRLREALRDRNVMGLDDSDVHWTREGDATACSPRRTLPEHGRLQRRACQYLRDCAVSEAGLPNEKGLTRLLD